MVPLHGHLFDCLHGLEARGCDNGNASRRHTDSGQATGDGLEDDYIVHTGERTGGRRIETRDFAAQGRAHDNTGVEHTGW